MRAEPGRRPRGLCVSGFPRVKAPLTSAGPCLRRVAAAPLLRPKPSASLAAGPAPQAPGKCAAPGLRTCPVRAAPGRPAFCSPIPGPLLPAPDPRSSLRSLGGAVSGSLLWQLRCGLEPFPSISLLGGASGAPQTHLPLRKTNQPFSHPCSAPQIFRPACTSLGVVLVLAANVLGAEQASSPGKQSGRRLLGDCAGYLPFGPSHQLYTEVALKTHGCCCL